MWSWWYYWRWPWLFVRPSSGQCGGGLGLVAVAVMSHDATGMASFFSALPGSWKLVRLPEFIWGHQAVEVVMATGIPAEKPYFGASAFVKDA